jgi:hypothetical protein
MKRILPFLLACSLLLSLLALSSCMSSSGGTLSRTTGAERAAVEKAPSQENKPPVPPSTGVVTTPAKGLLVVSTPSDAEVYLNGRFMGRTPLTIEDINQGAYRLILRKDGYYEAVAWVNFSGESMRFETNLVQITGFLQVAATPADALVFVGGRQISQGMTELPIGIYEVRLRAFGYTDYRETVTVSEKTVTELSAALSPAPFALSGLRTAKTSFNPSNPGVLGSLDITFEVTGPGTGVIAVEGAEGNQLFHAELPPFSTWNQTFTLSPGDSSALPDGEYTAVVSAHGPDTPDQERREVTFRVDRSIRIAPRAIWSGSAGLLFAPSAEVLPAESFQAQILAVGGTWSSGFRAPAILSARIGIGMNMEIDAAVSALLTEQAAPFGGAVAARYALVRPGQAGGFGAAVETKVSALVDPASGVWPTDPFSGFTGLGVSVPLQLSGGPLSLLVSGGITTSLWKPYVIAQDPALTAWAYLRGGLLLDLGSVTGGISISARTEPFTSGTLSIAFPVQAGAEVHWLIPGTHLLLSGAVLGEVDSAFSYYFLGGAGLGFLF